MIAHPYIDQPVNGVHAPTGRKFSGVVTDVYPAGTNRPSLVIVRLDRAIQGIAARSIAVRNTALNALPGPFVAGPETTLQELEEAGKREGWRLINLRPSYVEPGWVCDLESIWAPGPRACATEPTSWDALNKALAQFRRPC